MIQWQGYVVVTSKTWVQVPGLAYFVYYFVITVPMQRKHHNTPCASVIKPATYIPTLDQRPEFKAYHTLPVNASYWIQKVNKFWIALGLKCRLIPPKLGLPPPWFASSLSIYLFYYLILIIILFVSIN